MLVNVHCPNKVAHGDHFLIRNGHCTMGLDIVLSRGIPLFENGHCTIGACG
jgi:hypothetical protein